MAQTVGPRILFVPDTQCKPGVPMEHLEWLGRYAAHKEPDVIVHAGDHYDMASLSTYDAGKKAAEGRRYQDDIEAGDRGLELFDGALRRHARRSYRPRKVVTLGNHCERIVRAVDADAKLEGKVSLNDLAFKRFGWTPYPFLQPVTIHGVTFAHYFPLNAMGRVSNGRNGAPSALAQARRMMRSCVAGHRQGLDTAVVETPHGTVRGVIAGSFYQHDEGYMTRMGNRHWRGVLMLNDVREKTGEFDLCEVSLDYLRRTYG